MTFLFVVALILKNNGVADVGYGIGFVVFTYTAAYVSGLSLVSLFLLVPVTLWALRLALRILRKNYGKPEDFRYKAWRDAWGSSFVVRSYFQVYILQGLVIAIVSSAVVTGLVLGETLVTPLLTLGLLMWATGFYFESVADAQLDSFIKNPDNKGKILQSGLWKYSRHPNYFGESLMWFGLWVASIAFTPWVLLCVVSPLLITYLLLKVSGVPMLEKRWEGREDWEEYKKKTPVFIPRFWN
jgi:steroid 5-alpha reductase family enzyme